jgi:hypothetical protein
MFGVNELLHGQDVPSRKAGWICGDFLVFDRGFINEALTCRANECPTSYDPYIADPEFRRLMREQLAVAGIPLGWALDRDGGTPLGTSLSVRYLSGRQYLHGRFCERHNCIGQNLGYLYSPQGRRLIGRYLGDDGITWFGSPTQEEKSSLEEQAQ